LWNWFKLMGEGRTAARLRVEVVLLGPAAAGSTERVEVLRWVLTNALPTKFKAATFAATAAEVGVEELHLVHEGMRLSAGAAA
jgi:phage tail-like protein